MRLVVAKAILFIMIFFSPPAHAIGVLGDLFKEFIVPPGEKFKGEIVVANLSKTEAKAVKIYQTDIKESYDGKSNYGEPAGLFPRSNAKWIKFAPEILQLSGGSKSVVTFEGFVPPGNEGSFVSMLMIEKMSKDSAELKGAPTKKGNQLGITVKTRYAVRILTTVKNTGTKKIKFLNRQIDENKFFLVDIENTGNRYFESKFWVELFDSQGKPVGKFPEKSSRKSFPESSLRYRIDLSSVKPGKYTALCAIDAGDDDLFGARYQIEIK